VADLSPREPTFDLIFSGPSEMTRLRIVATKGARAWRIGHVLEAGQSKEGPVDEMKELLIVGHGPTGR